MYFLFTFAHSIVGGTKWINKNGVLAKKLRNRAVTLPTTSKVITAEQYTLTKATDFPQPNIRAVTIQK